MFERLTDKRGICSRCEGVDDCEYYAGEFSAPCPSKLRYDRLAAYEDSGISPEQVQQLAKAQADGRLDT